MTDFVSTLGAGATAYSLAAGTALLLQVRTMLRRDSSQDVSLTFLGTTSGGYLIWLLYGLGIGSMPLILSDAVGLACSLVAVAVAFRLRVRISDASESERDLADPATAPPLLAPELPSQCPPAVILGGR